MKNRIGLIVCSALLLFATSGCGGGGGGGGSSTSVSGAIGSFNTASEDAVEAECECRAAELGYSNTTSCVNDRHQPQELTQCQEQAASCDKSTFVDQVDCRTDAVKDYKNCLSACGGGTAQQPDAGGTGDSGTTEPGGDQDNEAIYQGCLSDYTTALTACENLSSDTLDTAFAECQRGEVPACFFDNTNNNTPDGGGNNNTPDGGGNNNTPDGGGDDVGFTDTDGDGFPDDVDNCPFTANPSQADSDGDGVGDACDSGGGDDCQVNSDCASGEACVDGACISDRDGDGIVDANDNCPDAYNPSQSDSDGDGIGDECDSGGDPNDPRIDSATDTYENTSNDVSETSCGCYYDLYDPPYSSETECINDNRGSINWSSCQRNAFANNVDSVVNWLGCYDDATYDLDTCLSSCPAAGDAGYTACFDTYEADMQSCDQQLDSAVIQDLNACAN